MFLEGPKKWSHLSWGHRSASWQLISKMARTKPRTSKSYASNNSSPPGHVVFMQLPSFLTLSCGPSAQLWGRCRTRPGDGDLEAGEMTGLSPLEPNLPSLCCAVPLLCCSWSSSYSITFPQVPSGFLFYLWERRKTAFPWHLFRTKWGKETLLLIFRSSRAHCMSWQGAPG